MRTESKDHEIAREKIAIKFNGVNLDHLSRKLNGYYPDVKNIDTDFEVEVYNKRSHIFNKKNKWDKERKKVLVIVIPKELRECFNEVILFDNFD